MSIDIFNKRKIKELENKIQNQKKAIYDYKRHIDDTNKLNKNLSESLNKELEQNKKLCDWIINILKEFGTTDVREKHINIPVINNGTTYTMLYEGTIKEKRIEIPSITIIKKEII